MLSALPFDVEKSEGEDDPHDGSVQKLLASGWAELRVKTVCPGRPQQPDDGESHRAVDAEYEEQGVSEDTAGDGEQFIEEVDCSWDSAGHFLDIRKRSAQALTIVYQSPGGINKGERDPQNCKGTTNRK